MIHRFLNMAIREVFLDIIKYAIFGSGGESLKENSGRRHKIDIRIMR